MLTRQKVGLFLMGFGLALPAIVYGIARIMLMMDSAKGGPPNQGAMVLAYLVIMASFGIGVLLIIIGACVSIFSMWQSRKQSPGRMPN